MADDIISHSKPSSPSPLDPPSRIVCHVYVLAQLAPGISASLVSTFNLLWNEQVILCVEIQVRETVFSIHLPSMQLAVLFSALLQGVYVYMCVYRLYWERQISFMPNVLQNLNVELRKALTHQHRACFQTCKHLKQTLIVGLIFKFSNGLIFYFGCWMILVDDLFYFVICAILLMIFFFFFHWVWYNYFPFIWCWQSHSLRCTESFMRENVVEELQHLKPNDETKGKMLNILKRFHSEEETEDMNEEGMYLFL